MDAEQRLRARASLIHMLQETELLTRQLGLRPEDFPVVFRMLYPDPFPQETEEGIARMIRRIIRGHPEQQSNPRPNVTLTGSYVLLQIGDGEQKTYYIAASSQDAYRTRHDPFNPHGSPNAVLDTDLFGILLRGRKVGDRFNAPLQGKGSQQITILDIKTEETP